MTLRVVAAAAVAVTTALTAAPAEATFPSRNGLLVFKRPVAKQVALFTVPPAGGAVQRLTRTRAWEEKAEWSPDGTRLAFGRSGPSGVPTEIATMSASGRDLRVPTSFGSSSQAPTWSPDGRIAYFSLFGARPLPSRELPPRHDDRLRQRPKRQPRPRSGTQRLGVRDLQDASRRQPPPTHHPQPRRRSVSRLAAVAVSERHPPS
jgi:hypothetical protein